MLRVVLFFLFLIGTADFFSAQRDSSAWRKCIASPDLLNGQTVYQKADTMPAFIGGISSFNRYFLSSLKFENDSPFSSKVYSTFVIDTLGKVHDVCILKGNAGENYAKQVIAVLQNSPPWTPAVKDSKKVCVRLFIPLRICLR